jgi:uncharacterized membrane protein
MKLKQFHFENITFWLVIIVVTFFCATGKMTDGLYSLILGIILGVTIGSWKSKANDKQK